MGLGLVAARIVAHYVDHGHKISITAGAQGAVRLSDAVEVQMQ
jgi:hypothetical protein